MKNLRSGIYLLAASGIGLVWYAVFRASLVAGARMDIGDVPSLVSFQVTSLLVAILFRRMLCAGSWGRVLVSGIVLTLIGAAVFMWSLMLLEWWIGSEVPPPGPEMFRNLWLMPFAGICMTMYFGWVM